MKYTYTAICTHNDDGSGYLCMVPDLPGCISSGASLDEAIDKITDAASVWLVDAEEENEDIISPTPQDQIEHDPFKSKKQHILQHIQNTGADIGQHDTLAGLALEA